MSRAPHYLGILEAMAVMQDNIALMLEAKAVEAEKSKNWICNHIFQTSFSDQPTQLKKTLEIHEKVVEVISGIVRMEQSLAANMKAMIGDNNEEQSEGNFDLGSMFEQSEDS